MLYCTEYTGCMFGAGLMSCGETSRKPIQQQNLSVGSLAGLFLTLSLTINYLLS